MPAISDPASAGLAGSTIARVWELRRRAEEQAGWQRPAVAVLAAAWFVVIVNPDLIPGGFPVALAGLVALAAVAIGGIVMWARRASIRGHSGNVEGPDPPRRWWWRNPALAAPAMFTVAFLGRLIGAFDHLPVILGTAVVGGIAVAAVLPRLESADHINGPRLENPPELTADAAATVAAGELTPDVLELLVLQHHTGERRISWCADVLGTDPADIRHRIACGRRWLELPATEVHDPATAGWVRLSANGREALGYV